MAKMKPQFLFWRAEVALAILLALVVSFAQAHAQTNDCDNKYEGVEFCVHEGGNVLVIRIDLSNPNVRFETVMAAYPLGNNQWRECTDVNVPPYAIDGRGCAFPNPTTFPSQLVADMMTRYPGAVTAINGDYFAPDYTHGPEGLTVKNGVRFDGWRWGDCDNITIDEQGKPFVIKSPSPCRGNDVNRPALKISKTNRVELGAQMWADVENPANYSDRFWNVIAGGPMLVEKGVPKTNQQACGTRWPNINLANTSKMGDCERTIQSGVGITRDGKTLLLVFVKTHDAAWMANFLQKEYNVETAMKLDGGGSTQLWYDGEPFYNDEQKRPVANALVLFAPERGKTPPPGQGNDWGERLSRWFQERQRGIQKWFEERQRDAADWVQRWLDERERDAQRWADDRAAEVQRQLEQQVQEAQKRAEQELERQLNSLCSVQVFAVAGVFWVYKRRAHRKR